MALETIDSTHVRVWFYDIDLGVFEVEPADTDALIERWLSSRSRAEDRWSV